MLVRTGLSPRSSGHIWRINPDSQIVPPCDAIAGPRTVTTSERAFGGKSSQTIQASMGDTLRGRTVIQHVRRDRPRPQAIQNLH